jgi:tyrosine-protein phosphatase YwqE
MGTLFQINLNSIVGYYNKSIKNIAEQLIKDSLVDFIGSDTHHITHLKSLKKSLNQTLYKKIFKYNTILNDTL